MMDTKPTTSRAEAWAAHYRCVYLPVSLSIENNCRLSDLSLITAYFPCQQQLSSWEQVKCGKTEEHVFASEQSHKYLNTYPTRTLVM